MADFVKPANNAPAEIGFTLEGMQASQRKAFDILQKSVPQIEASAKSLQTLTTVAAQEIQGSYQNIDHALTRQRNNSMNPKIWNDIVGFFDSDYNDDYQRAQVDIELSKLNETATVLQTAEAVHSTLINTVNQQVAAAADAAALVKEGLVAPLEIEGKRLANASLGQQLQMGQIQLTAARREELLGGANEDNLRGMMAGTLPMPDGVTPFHLEMELARRTQIEQSIQIAQFEFNAANDQAGRNALQSALEKFSAAELEKLEQQAIAGNGVIELAPGVVVNAHQLAQVKLLALTREREQDKVIGDLIATSVEAEATLNASEQQTSLIVTQVEGNVDPAFQTAVAAHKKKLETFSQLIETGQLSQTAGAGLIAEAVSKHAEAVKAEQQRIIDLAPTEHKGAVKEFLQTGRVADNNNAAALLVDVAANPYAFHADPYFKDAFSLLSKNILQQRQDQANVVKKVNVGVGDESTPTLEMEKAGKLDPVVQIRKALTTPDEEGRTALELAAGIGVQWLLEESFKELVAKEAVVPLANRFWSKFYDPNSKTYANSFYGPDGAFAMDAVFQQLAAEDVKLGKTMGVTHTQQLLDLMGKNTMIEKYIIEASAAGNAKKASFVTLLGGREALYIGLNDAVGQLNQTGLSAMRKAAGETVPGAGTPVGDIMQQRSVQNFDIYNNIIGSVDRALQEKQ
jgi:hypothetical protein